MCFVTNGGKGGGTTLVLSAMTSALIVKGALSGGESIGQTGHVVESKHELWLGVVEASDRGALGGP